MTNQRLLWATACAALLGLAGCASRPVNPPITQVDPDGGYTFQTRQKHFKSQDTLVVLAFSGGGTRAAAFSYGVLEFLRRTEVADLRYNYQPSMSTEHPMAEFSGRLSGSLRC